VNAWGKLPSWLALRGRFDVLGEERDIVGERAQVRERRFSAVHVALAEAAVDGPKARDPEYTLARRQAVGRRVATEEAVDAEAFVDPGAGAEHPRRRRLGVAVARRSSRLAFSSSPSKTLT
jgi:hypothetical protein